MSSIALTPEQHRYLANCAREMREFDARPGRYKPKQQITPIGAALLLHLYIEDMDRRERGEADVQVEHEHEGGEA